MFLCKLPFFSMYMYIYISHDNDNCDIFCIKSIEGMGGATFCMIENYWTYDSRNEDFKLTIPNLSGIYFVLFIKKIFVKYWKIIFGKWTTKF